MPPQIISKDQFATDMPSANPGGGQVISAAELGEPLPRYASGLSPKTPINQSPVSLEDRLKLSIGNEKGKIEFLKQNYGEVNRAPNGDLLIKGKGDGLWRRVDPDGLGSGNPWEQIKEFISDAADWAPEIVKTGVQTGIQSVLSAGTAAASVATGGAALAPSLAAQATTAGATAAFLQTIQTSLGRAVGTYDATPEEQLSDIATETMLNIGGTYIAAGVMKKAKELPNLLAKSGNALKSMDEHTQNAVAFMRQTLQKIPAEQTKTLINHGDEVAAAVSRGLDKAPSIEAAQQYLKEESIGAMQEIGNAIKATREQVYKSLKEDAINAIANDPQLAANFKPDAQGAYNVLNNLVKNGLGSYKNITNSATGAVARKEFVIHSAEEIEKNFLRTGEVTRAVGLDKAKTLSLLHNIAKDFQHIADANYAPGAQGMKQMIDVQGKVRSLTEELFNYAEKYGNSDLIGVAKEIRTVANQAIESNFNLAKPVIMRSISQMPKEIVSNFGLETVTNNPVAAMNKFYNVSSALFKPLEGQIASGGTNAFESLLNQVTADGPRNVAKKSALEAFAALSKGAAPEINKVFEQSLHKIRINGTAIGNLPWARPGLISSTAGAGTISGLASGHPGLVAGAAAAGAATSPRLTYSMIRAGQKSLQMLKNMSPTARAVAAKTPGFFGSVINTWMEVPNLQQQTMSTLMQEGLKEVRGGQ